GTTRTSASPGPWLIPFCRPAINSIPVYPLSALSPTHRRADESVRCLLTRVTSTTPSPTPGSSWNDLVPYAAPMIAFGIVTTLEGSVPAAQYPLVYIAKILIVTLTLWRVWPTAARTLTLDGRHVPLSILVGLIVFVAWVGIDQYVPYPHLGSRVGFDPYTV